MIEEYVIKNLRHIHRRKFKFHCNKIIRMLRIKPTEIDEISDKIKFSKHYTREMLDYMEYDKKVKKITRTKWALAED